MSNWIETIIPLPRPEYPKQPEMLLTDLLWRSKGSILSLIKDELSGETSSYLRELGKLTREENTKKLPSPERLIFRQTQGTTRHLLETMPLAERTAIDDLIATDSGPSPIPALLASIIAPRSRKVKSESCIPIHPDVVGLQTLHGALNRDDPPNLANIIEVIGYMGGAKEEGQVASLFLDSFNQKSSAVSGLTGLLDTLIPRVAQHVWLSIPKYTSSPDRLMPPWPQPQLTSRSIETTSSMSRISHYKGTPFHWFWHKWEILCNPDNGWYDKLPARRFVDWAMCLLRTGLAFSYLWEADFFCKLQLYINEVYSETTELTARNTLMAMLNRGSTLASIEPPDLPATQKHAWSAISTLLAKGYTIRKHLDKAMKDNSDMFAPNDEELHISLERWVTSLPPAYLKNLATGVPLPSRDTANNAKEFVRYLLLARSSDDDTADQTDLYYLARSNSNSFWFHPGPEWLVSIISLLGREAGGKCTLGMLMDDLARLGIRVERWVLVGLLEEAGLSSDSPDADNALVIHSGF